MYCTYVHNQIGLFLSLLHCFSNDYLFNSKIYMLSCFFFFVAVIKILIKKKLGEGISYNLMYLCKSFIGKLFIFYFFIFYFYFFPLYYIKYRY